MSDILVAPEALSLEPDRTAIIRGGESPICLKVCLIAETFQAGVGRHIVDIVSGLSDAGHEIHLIHSPTRTDPNFLATIQRRNRVRCVPLAMSRAIGARDVIAFSRIVAHIRATGPFDIIHGHSSKGGGYARLVKLLGYGPVVYSPHAFVTMSPLLTRSKRLLYRALERCLARLTDRVVCTSVREQHHARELGHPIDRLSLIVNGYTPSAVPSREVVRRKLGIERDQVVLGFAGRLEPQKAPERVIAAAKRLLPELPQLVLLMVGSGPNHAALEHSIRSSHLEDRVRWLEGVDARQFLPGMDIFVLPSLYEGCAYVLLEALSAGLPIVTTPVGGSDEAVAQGINGFVVPHDSVEAMTAAIHGLATDFELRRRMAEASRERAATFTVSKMLRSIESLYLELVNAERATRGDLPLPALALRSY